MNKNTFSLLNSNWMFTDGSKNQLLPYLLNILNGSPIDLKDSITPTSHYLINSIGAASTINDAGDSHNQESVVVLKMHHPIFKYDQNCGPKGTQTIMKMMDDWKDDNSIKGVVFDMNSGGGQASGNQEWADYLNSYPKPTATYTNDIVGSAAYYGASGTNYIVANAFADFIGCIGTMFYSVNMEGVITKAGGEVIELYADNSPEKNLQSRELKKGNSRPFIEKIINPSAERFHADMKKYRPQITELALKGDIFSPTEALEQGLIDEIGTLQTAIDKVFSLAQANKGNSNNNNHSKLTKMSKTNLPLIEAVLGAKFEEDETKDGVILSEANANTIEAALASKDKAIADAATAATASANKITELESNSSTVSTAIQAALKEAEVEGAEKMSIEEGITALSALVKEYGSRDGAGATQTNDDADNKSFVGSTDNKLSEIVN